MATPREHIEELRRRRFSIGKKQNPLASMLDQAVKYLSAELYAKDVHFLMELIQNAEDNEYPDGVDPSLEFVITSRDITGTGAPATLLVFNNEKGFSAWNIESICSVGSSSKKGKRKRGYIGEKGIGFKSVFLITSRPHIFSNGYQIRFNEKPCQHCKLGYVVPEWVDDEKPSLSDIQKVYGFGSLPTTTLVLPLKPDKVKPVKEQLSSVHPEVLLFLSKIKQLSVREDNQDPNLNTVAQIAITKEVNFVSRKNMDAESSTLHLSADINTENGGQCSSYYLWKQRFPVKRECRVESRIDVEECQVTLAFPIGERLHKGVHSPGIYAFLPTEMVTNFPFIIQGDFILSSSREALLLDNIWNQGILDCVPSAFVNALISLVKTVENAPVSSMAPMFKFLPVDASSYTLLNTVRESIRLKLGNESILPSESCKEQKFFHKPSEVRRLIPEFWNILKKASLEKVNLNNLSSHGCYILNSSFDHKGYDEALNFLGVGFVEDEWYTKCIQSSSLLKRISDSLYVELLYFISRNWSTKLRNANMTCVPLLRHVGADGNVSICSMFESLNKMSRKVLCVSSDSSHASLLIDWNKEFWNISPYLFIPKTTQVALRSFEMRDTVIEWLKSGAGLVELDVHKYSSSLSQDLRADQELAVAYAHFLYHSHTANFLSDEEVHHLCLKMPLVDSYGTLISSWKQVLIPGSESKWLELIGTNPWTEEGFIELGEDYLQTRRFCAKTSGGKLFMDFLNKYVGASDIPWLSPPDAEIPTISGSLTKKNAFRLLDWIQYLISRKGPTPNRFLTCISEGSWLKVTMNGSSGYKPPSQSFMLAPKKTSSNWGSILQDGSVLADIPLVDLSFYGENIVSYESSLKAIGVMTEYNEACIYIGSHLMSQVDSATSTRSTVFAILKFIRFLREKFLPPETFISSIKEGKWLQTTSQSFRSPNECVLRNEIWAIAQQISELHFIDDSYYGQEIHSFDEELKLLGVTVDFKGGHELVVQHLKSSSSLSGLSKEALFLILECVRYSNSATKVVTTVQNAKCLKTSSGYTHPGETFLYDTEWGCLLGIFQSSPAIENKFYGNEIISYKDELKKLGVKVDFEDASEAFLCIFKQQVSVSKMTKEHVLSFLSCYRKLKKLQKPLRYIKKCIRSEKWLRTRLGDYRSPADCILFGPDWKYLAAVTCLPFLDDSANGYGTGIHRYAAELKKMGVVSSLQDGAKLVPTCLCFPDDASTFSSKSVLSLLECIRILLEQKDYSFPESFTNKVSRQWLKTSFGYRAPKDCCLFDSSWETDLKPTDGPFIDESFFGPKISSYAKELSKLGVHTDATEVCKLLSSELVRHSELTAIIRVYDFLRVNEWKAENKSTGKIWFPHGSSSGEWVHPGECVLHDKADLFSSQLYVLEKHYSSQLLTFFHEAFGVQKSPSVTHYCDLWEEWESSDHRLSPSECCAFWKFFAGKKKGARTEAMLAGKLLMVPVVSGSGEIVLSDKRDVFIADDLLLKQLFSEHPIFVWYPQPSLPNLSRTKLLEVYRGIGVRGISESVQKEENSIQGSRQLNPEKVLIGKELAKIILGFLANPSLEMEASQRQEKLKSLLNLTVLETLEPMTVTYSLKLSSTGEVIRAKATQMIRWDREDSKLYVQKQERYRKKRSVIEYACRFAEVIAKGVLWEEEDHIITALSGIIRLGFLMKFDKAAVDFLMKANNLQIFMEDVEFLSSAFSSS